MEEEKTGVMPTDGAAMSDTALADTTTGTDTSGSDSTLTDTASGADTASGLDTAPGPDATTADTAIPDTTTASDAGDARDAIDAPADVIAPTDTGATVADAASDTLDATVTPYDAAVDGPADGPPEVRADTGLADTSSYETAQDACAADACASTARSCEGAVLSCGASESCCVSPLVVGGTFKRSYDGSTATDPKWVSTVDTFRLDRYEVTVGRFRRFVAAVEAGWTPAAGGGKHVHLNAGNGLALTTGGYEPGWNSAWTANLPKTTGAWNSALVCNASYATWTTTADAAENKPINCVDQFEAYAFCIWDGGFLPSEAEWNYAAAGGSEQRVWPWSDPPSSQTNDDSHAVWCSNSCAAAQNVGSKSPRGDGRWGHSDLAGNVFEWTLDTAVLPYATETCSNCVHLTTGTAMIRGGSFNLDRAYALVAYRYSSAIPARSWAQGIRCARAP